MKICSKCGAQLQDDMRFCTNCGTPYEDIPGSSSQTSQSQEAEKNPYQSQNTYQDTGAYQNSYQEQNAYQDSYQGQNSYQDYYQGQNSYQNSYQGQDGYQNYAPYDMYDHTAEFDAQDVSDNKVICMLAYLMGTVGVIVALLVSSSSPYVAFHVRQALKFTVISILTGIVTLLLCWTIIVPIAALIFTIVLFVIRIICFFQICSGKAIEPYIIRNFGFLK